MFHLMGIVFRLRIKGELEDAMNYRLLGKTGMKVSPFCLGTMMFGKGGNPNHDECINMIHKALDTGINFVDTADRYNNGESEEILGKALGGRREHIVIATKVWGAMGSDPNQQGGSRRWILKAVEDSLRRLQTDYIDIYHLHRPTPETDLEETLSAFSDLLRSGKVRTIGTSTFPASDIVEAQRIAEFRALARFRIEQQPYSILNRQIEKEILPACQRYGMGVSAWSPLAKGMLTGKHRKGNKDVDSIRVKYFAKAMSDENSLAAVEELIPLAESAGLSLTHMALAFVVSHPAITSAIIGPRTPEQLDDLLAGMKVTLSDEVLDQIDKIVLPGTDIAPLDMSAYIPQSISDVTLRRRPLPERIIL
ncbi:aldo/keto reductase [Leptospira sp. 96542]|nr:aldo/keto reductase [Leptospira sp. 96542]